MTWFFFFYFFFWKGVLIIIKEKLTRENKNSQESYYYAPLTKVMPTSFYFLALVVNIWSLVPLSKHRLYNMNV